MKPIEFLPGPLGPMLLVDTCNQDQMTEVLEIYGKTLLKTRSMRIPGYHTIVEAAHDQGQGVAMLLSPYGSIYSVIRDMGNSVYNEYQQCLISYEEFCRLYDRNLVDLDRTSNKLDELIKKLEDYEGT